MMKDLQLYKTVEDKYTNWAQIEQAERILQSKKM